MSPRDRPSPRHAVTAPIALAGALSLAACSEHDWPDEGASLYAAMGEPLPTIDDDERERFERGRDVALRRIGVRQGLGPEFNATFCLACHEKPTVGGSASRYRDVFVTPSDEPELEFSMIWSTQSAGPADVEPHPDATVRNPIPLFGLGLLAELPAEALLEHADPNDLDGDGISGRVNFERGFVGRFGRKAQMATLTGFVRLALLDHMGVTTDPADMDTALGLAPGPRELPTTDADEIADPEMGREELADLITFVARLAPPPPAPASPRTERGDRLMEQCRCTGCHVPALEGPRGPVFAYSDLLLHDMGPMLADDIELGEARGSEYRTQPLWGLAATGPYLHDGRADTLDAAIRWHDGEAADARACYEQLDAEDRGAVQDWLRSRGGDRWRPDGLLPEGAPLPAPGEPGGPLKTLTAAERERFDAGRRLFDRDFGRGDGLGPRFNGDSCRSCHFDPAIGGAGPLGVDVVRRFTDDRDAQGEVAHRFETTGRRPALLPDVAYERRQTPTLLGLGLIDQIPDAVIEANADPDDGDGDGIRGRVSRLADGSVGRFGWTAQVPTLADFARDAMSTEMGITVPPASSSFGSTTDDDEHPDPELDADALEDLRFYMASLAPPPRRSSAPEAEARGQAVFDAIGCAACHRPELSTADGATVALYSDLLLHDVQTGRVFRTPPLWGVVETAPYLHDGSAPTLEDAIAGHAGEARPSVLEFESLPRDDVRDLLAFLASL